MLPSQYRLNEKRDFDRVLKKGLMEQTSLFGLGYLKLTDNLPSRFGLIVSKRISKRAVDRNRIKRILRESLRHLLEKMDKGFMVVILAKHKLLYSNQKEAEEVLAMVLNKIGAIK
ncbi:ribonuclease P protein component [Candidatus Microgenomates bacterium]|nr:ribonuclease P protein component [Candidatus Microgenomates bacterium]